MTQTKLIDLDPKKVTVNEISIVGATGLPGGEELQTEQRVSLDGLGEIVGIRIFKRTRRLKGGGKQEYWVRRIEVKAEKIALNLA